MKNFTAAVPVFITSGTYLNGLGASSPIMLLSKQNEVESLYNDLRAHAKNMRHACTSGW